MPLTVMSRVVTHALVLHTEAAKQHFLPEAGDQCTHHLFFWPQAFRVKSANHLAGLGMPITRFEVPGDADVALWHIAKRPGITERQLSLSMFGKYYQDSLHLDCTLLENIGLIKRQAGIVSMRLFPRPAGNTTISQSSFEGMIQKSIASFLVRAFARILQVRGTRMHS